MRICPRLPLGPLQRNLQSAAGGCCDPFQRAGAGADTAAFEAGDRALAGADSAGEIGLGETSAAAGGDEGSGQIIFGREGGISLLVRGLLVPIGEGGFGGNGLAHINSFARARASSISRRGVACVFFTKVRRITIRRPDAVT